MRTLKSCACLFIATVSLAADPPPTQSYPERLESIHARFVHAEKASDISELVRLDRELEIIMDEITVKRLWGEARTWAKDEYRVMGVYVEHLSDALYYSRLLLFRAHEINPTSPYRNETLFGAIAFPIVERGDCCLSLDIPLLYQYLNEFPDGPHAGEVLGMLGGFYADLYRVLSKLEQEKPELIEAYECYKDHINERPRDEQKRQARLQAEVFTKMALSKLPAGHAKQDRYEKQLEYLQKNKMNVWHFYSD